MAKKSRKEAAQTAAKTAPETEDNVPPLPSTAEETAAGQEVSGFSPPDQHPLSDSGHHSPSDEPEPVTQPTEQGLIEPLPESAPAEATNQPAAAETPNPPEAETQPPPSQEGAGEAAAPPAQNLPSPSLIQRASAYQAPAGKPSNVIRRFVTPPPPDVLVGKL